VFRHNALHSPALVVAGREDCNSYVMLPSSLYPGNAPPSPTLPSHSRTYPQWHDSAVTSCYIIPIAQSPYLQWLLSGQASYHLRGMQDPQCIAYRRQLNLRAPNRNPFQHLPGTISLFGVQLYLAISHAKPYY